MTRPIVCLAFLATAALAAGDTRAAEPPRKPNIVMILTDDLGYADVGFQGSTDIPTPHLDALAKSGVRCTQGYVTHPFCSPTRAGLLTGRYQQRFGHENNPVYDPENSQLGLPLDQVTVADALKAAGYATGCVGKWHLGAARPSIRTGAASTTTSGSWAAATSISSTTPSRLTPRRRARSTSSRCGATRSPWKNTST